MNPPAYLVALLPFSGGGNANGKLLFFPFLETDGEYFMYSTHVRSCAIRRAIGCVNSCGSQEAGFTQLRAHLIRLEMR